jgi:hypothetical protein
MGRTTMGVHIDYITRIGYSYYLVKDGIIHCQFTDSKEAKRYAIDNGIPFI